MCALDLRQGLCIVIHVHGGGYRSGCDVVMAVACCVSDWQFRECCSTIYFGSAGRRPCTGMLTQTLPSSVYLSDRIEPL